MKPPRNFNPVPYPYGTEIELVIDNLSNLGEGVGRVDGWVVFVPYALPGERVRVRVWRNKSNYSNADLVQVLEPSPHRVDPVCPLFGTCGGCQYQHCDYTLQLDWKTRQVVELLRRIGGIEHPVDPCIGSPLQYGYRSKITPHYRTAPTDSAVAIGFQKADSRAIVDIPACPIASPAINERLPVERAALRSGERRAPRGGTLLLRDTAHGVVSDMKAVVEERIGPFTFEFLAGEFFQNNPHILPRLVDHALTEAGATGARYLVDTYCGVGVFAICGHRAFQQVVGVEVSPAGLMMAQRNQVRNQAANCSFVLGSAEAVFDGLTFAPQDTAVLMDPPRAGSDRQFLDQLVAWRPARIVYVSCGPDTQARDLRVLVDGGYTITRVQPFDLFPQTRHVECVVSLSAPAG
jgi:23S rRNA (uracil1939-C5)-methyltransferase